MRISELERRLIEWAEEYSGARYEHIGWPGSSTLAVMMTYHGRAPQGLKQRTVIGTAADEIEMIVQAMAKQPGGRVSAAVLRTEYWMKSAALEHKLDRLRVIDRVFVSEDDYQRLMVNARDFVSAALAWQRDMSASPDGVA